MASPDTGREPLTLADCLCPHDDLGVFVYETERCPLHGTHGALTDRGATDDELREAFRVLGAAGFRLTHVEPYGFVILPPKGQRDD